MTHHKQNIAKACQQSMIDAEARGYVGELYYQEQMAKRYTQHKCNKCDRWHIWKMKNDTP